MTGASPRALSPLSRSIDYAALLAVFAAPLVYGSYPPWAAGFACAAFCILGLGHVLERAALKEPLFRGPRPVFVLALALLAWETVTVLRDVWLGGEALRAPALSLRTLPFGFAFFAAFLLGSRFAAASGLSRLLTVLTACGVVLGGVALGVYSGLIHDPVPGRTYEPIRRAMGLAISPNRFAVMQSICGASALALFGATTLEGHRQWDSRSQFRRALLLGVYAAAAALICSSVALSLSRLTIVSFGVSIAICALIWIRRRSRANSVRFSDLSLPDRIQSLMLTVLPLVLLAGWLAWSFGIGARDLTSRFNVFRVTLAEGKEDRFDAMKFGVKMIVSAPLFGAGLGNFEAAFTAAQPAGLFGRWTRLHCDWLQLAVETGLPALLLVIATVLFWLRGWWRALSSAGLETNRDVLLRLIPFAGMLTALACAAADFPFHETGLACAAAMLAGALGTPAIERATPPTRAASTHLAWAAAVPLILAFAAGAFVSARNAAAIASSPWLGQGLFPPRTGSDPQPWIRAARIDPDEPALHYFAAVAASEDAHADDVILEAGLHQAALSAALVPLDFHPLFVSALINEKLGRWDEAADLYARATLLAPRDDSVWLNAGLLNLRRRSATFPQGSLQREAGLEDALRYFRGVMERSHTYDEQILKWLEGSGFTPPDMARLWPANTAAGQLRRARFFYDREYFLASRIELENYVFATTDSGFQRSYWYHLLAGSVAIVSGTRDYAGEWTEALGEPEFARDTQAVDWLARRYVELDEKTVGNWSESAAELNCRYPVLVHALATRLFQLGKPAGAEKILEKCGSEVDFIQRLWAEICLSTGDFAAAEEHARKAGSTHGRAGDWYSNWYSEFSSKIELSRKKRESDRP